MTAPPTCPKCRAALPGGTTDTAPLEACPACRVPLRFAVFPASLDGNKTGATAEELVVPGEAACFYHPTKKAAVPCDGCGRFLCGLCDLPIADAHYCPACLQAGQHDGRGAVLEPRRTRHDHIVWYILVVGLLTCGFAMPLTGPFAFFWALRHLNSPPSRVDASRRRLLWSIPFALIELAAGVALWFAAFTGRLD